MGAAETEFTRQLLAVAAVFFLLAGALWKWRGRAWPVWPRPAHRLASTGRLVLTPQHALHLVTVDDREMVVATHPHGCTVLRERPLEPSQEAAA